MEVRDWLMIQSDLIMTFTDVRNCNESSSKATQYKVLEKYKSLLWKAHSFGRRNAECFFLPATWWKSHCLIKVSERWQFRAEWVESVSSFRLSKSCCVSLSFASVSAPLSISNISLRDADDGPPNQPIRAQGSGVYQCGRG